MLESLIDRQTAAIVESFKNVTGICPIFTMGDFLLVRKAAVEEIRSGLTGASGISATTEKTGRLPESGKMSAGKPLSVPGKAAPIKELVPKPSTEETADDGPESDFAMLRQIKDEWN